MGKVKRGEILKLLTPAERAAVAKYFALIRHSREFDGISVEARDEYTQPAGYLFNYKWRAMLFHRGNNTRQGKWIYIYHKDGEQPVVGNTSSIYIAVARLAKQLGAEHAIIFNDRIIFNINGKQMEMKSF